MNYHTEDIEGQLIATLEANTDLSDVKMIDTHAGEITEQTFRVPEMAETIPRPPFIFVQYQGRRSELKDSRGSVWLHYLTWRLFIGATSLKDKRSPQLTAYAMLRAVYDSLHGKVCKSTPQTLATLTTLNGTAITTTNFNQHQPFFEVRGDDERLLVNMPAIVVYSSDWSASFLT